jgi:hypothetical protein
LDEAMVSYTRHWSGRWIMMNCWLRSAIVSITHCDSCASVYPSRIVSISRVEILRVSPGTTM